jgi:hypothetical protein
MSIGESLVSWLRSQGRQAELVLGETGSFAASPAERSRWLSRSPDPEWANASGFW